MSVSLFCLLTSFLVWAFTFAAFLRPPPFVAISLLFPLPPGQLRSSNFRVQLRWQMLSSFAFSAKHLLVATASGPHPHPHPLRVPVPIPCFPCRHFTFVWLWYLPHSRVERFYFAWRGEQERRNFLKRILVGKASMDGRTALINGIGPWPGIRSNSARPLPLPARWSLREVIKGISLVPQRLWLIHPTGLTECKVNSGTLLIYRESPRESMLDLQRHSCYTAAKTRGSGRVRNKRNLHFHCQKIDFNFS